MRLIINADDAGIDAARNRGIMLCVRNSALKSTSVIVEQGGWKDFLERKRPLKSLDTGLHFNLTAGRPLTSGLKTLVDQEGNFFNKFQFLDKAVAGEIDPQEVARELFTQLQIFKESGLTLSHVDGHHHVHILPGVREGFLKVVPAGTWVRLPFKKGVESLGPQRQETADDLYNNLSRFLKLINFWSLKAKDIWKDHYRSIDDFGGTTLTDAPTFKGLKKEISALTGDICELMVHPGGDWDGTSVRFSRFKARQIERDLLLSEELKEFLSDSKIEVISYLDVL